MNRSVFAIGAGSAGVPRVCGDEPAREYKVNPRILVFPACAGMNRLPAVPRNRRSSVPRVCGDEPKIPAGVAFGMVCSPRVRG